MEESPVELVRGGFEAASRGDIDAIAALLAPDVYWGPAHPGPAHPGPAGATEGGCHNRGEALEWMRRAIAQGIRVKPVEVRELADGRVLVLLQRTTPRPGDTELPEPHGEIITFRGDQVIEMAVYPTSAAAEAAARDA